MTEPVNRLSGVTLKVATEMADVGAFLTWLGGRRDVLGFDLETTGLDWVNGKIRTFQFGDAETGWVFRYDLWAGILDEVLRKYDRPMTGHNVILFDTMWTHKAGHVITRPHLLDDTLAMHFAYRPEEPHALKVISDRHISPQADILQKMLHDGMEKNGWDWATVPWEFKPFQLYSALDGPLAAHTWKWLHETGFHRETYEVERQVMLAAADMQRRGMHVDIDYARELHADLGDIAERLKAEAADVYGVVPSKNAEVAAALLEAGAPLTETTPTGAWKLDKAVLDGLAEHYPLASLVRRYKNAVKFRKAYVEKAYEMADSDDLVHASISTLGAVTGRMSVGGWPVQQLPAGNRAVRQMVTSRYDGGALVSVDQSNIEMRTVAHLSGERAAIDAFMRGEDVHQFMADIVFPGDPNGRTKVKTVSFAKLYGSGVGKMAVTLGSSLAHAQEILDAYDTKFPDLAEWTRYVREIGQARLRSDGRAYITLPSGRQLGLNSRDARAGAFYKLVNYAGQGLAAELMKRDIVSLYLAGLMEYAIMPVHDEILFDLPPEIDPADFADAVQAIMNKEPGTALTVPIATDAEIYPNHWGDCVKLPDKTYTKLSKEQWRARLK